MDEIKVLNKGFVRLVSYMASDPDVVQAARVSYGNGTKAVSEDRDLIRYLLRNQHMSPFEMCEFKIHMKLPIFVARQFVRHRTSSINEISARYSELPEEFYVPEIKDIQKQSKNNKQGRGENFSVDIATQIISKINETAEISFDRYHELLELDLAKEISRINLPVSTYTEWYFKMDLRNLFNFLKLRLDKHAQLEARMYAEAVYDLIKPIVPVCCEAFEDYILNAKTFSAQEMEILKKIINVTNISEFPNLSKREIKEFIEKLSK